MKDSLPELPEAKMQRYSVEYNLSQYDAEVLISSKEMTLFFEKAVEIYNEPKIIANWLMVDISAMLKEHGQKINEVRFTPKQLVDLLKLIKKDVISGTAAKQVLGVMFETGENPEEIVKEKGLAQMSNTDELEGIVREIIENNPKSVEDIRSGKEKAYGFFTGQVMKATKGKANPKLANELIRKIVKEYL
jgi:aspartyl-tRNA(Asn)/glutamyl-tRNA(Gln) amidotransferase subunit B